MTVARVHLSGEPRRLANGDALITIDAATVEGLIIELAQRFPGIEAHLRHGTSVAVDGEIMPHADFVPINSETDIHFLPAIGGGASRPRPNRRGSDR